MTCTSQQKVDTHFQKVDTKGEKMVLLRRIKIILCGLYEKNSIFRKTSAASYAVLYHASERVASVLSHDVTKRVKEMSMTKSSPY